MGFRVEFDVVGNPKGQPRARAIAFGGKARVHNPATADDWKALVAIEARKHVPERPLTGPVSVDLQFRFRRPRHHYGTGKNHHTLKANAPLWHTSKPDRDNLEKAVLDVLTDIGMLADDSIVCDGHNSKFYADETDKPGVTIYISEIEST